MEFPQLRSGSASHTRAPCLGERSPLFPGRRIGGRAARTTEIMTMNRRSFFRKAVAGVAATLGAPQLFAEPDWSATLQPGERVSASTFAQPTWKRVKFRPAAELEEMARVSKVLREDQGFAKRVACELFPGKGMQEARAQAYLKLNSEMYRLRMPCDGTGFNFADIGRDALVERFYGQLQTLRLGNRYLGFQLHSPESFVASINHPLNTGLLVSVQCADFSREASEYRPDKGRAEFIFVGHKNFS